MSRVGTFLILLGILLCALYLLSDIAGTSNFWFLLAGGAGIASGLLVRLSEPKNAPPQPSGRFRLIRELRNPKPKAPREKKPLLSFKLGKPKPSASSNKGQSTQTDTKKK